VNRISSVVTLLVLLAACSPAEEDPAATQDAVSEETIQALQVELVEADRAFARSVAQNRLAGWISGFAPNGRMVAGGEAYVGAEGIRRQMLPAFADTSFHLSWDPTFAAVAGSGELGYTVGTYEESRRADGERVVERGTYLTVWRRQEDGVWKVEADIGNPAASRLPPETEGRQ
jgi:ketosteroid isomerase-like protein